MFTQTILQIFLGFISVAAFLVSLFNLWFSVLRRGTICSTHPSFIAIRYDFVGRRVPLAKVFARPLLYSTGKRGNVIEHLFIRVKGGGRQIEFSFWGYGETDHLVIGSGLSVPESGISTNHHFNPVTNDELFLFSGGDYTLELVANVVGHSFPVSLWTVDVTVPDNLFIKDGIVVQREVSFNWSPGQRRFITSTRERR